MQSKFSLRLVVSCAIVLSLWGVNSSCAQAEHSRSTRSQLAQNSISAVGRTVQPKPSTWKYSNEQEWLVDNVGRDIAEMLTFAKNRKDGKPKFSGKEIVFKTTTLDTKAGSYKFDFAPSTSSPPLEFKFTLTDYAWSPANYEPFAKKILQQLGLVAAGATSAPSDFVKTLAEAEMPVLFKENERVSKELSEHPLDAGLHEQAALIQATFDMLELAGGFSDTRPPLARISAHLSLARALNNDKLSNVGRIADIALESMSCRDGVAADMIGVMEKENLNAAERSWLRALKIRSTGDYRVFDEKEPTPLEASQYGLRYSYLRSGDAALEYVRKHYPKMPMRWMRIITSGYGSVGSGHAVDSHMVNAELSDFAHDFQAYKKTAPDSDFAKVVGQLNLTPTRCLTDNGGEPVLNVLSWDDVAAYHCRHILCGVVTQHRFYQKMYGVPQMAKQTVDHAKKSLSSLVLFPFSLKQVEWEPAEAQEVLTRAQDVFQVHPELVTANNWDWIQDQAKTKAPREDMVLVSPDIWFEPPMPMGTAYYFIDRKYCLETYKPDLTEIDRLHKICPLDEVLCDEWAKLKFGENPSSDQLKEAYGALLEFDVDVLVKVARASVDKPESFVPLLEKVASLDSDYYFALGNYCVFHGRPDKGAEYFELALEKCHDSVLAANNCGWLINWRYDHGKKDKAKELAEFAGGVYSHRGLQSLGLFNERTGDLAAAESAFRAIGERYGGKTELCAFLMRNSGANKTYADQAARLQKEFFPAGMKKTALVELTDPPTTGVFVKEPNWLVSDPVLKANTIVVAVNGIRVENAEQYEVAADSNLDPKIALIVWDGKTYRKTDMLSMSNHRLGIDMEDYKISEQAAKIQQPILNFLENLNAVLTEQRKKMEQQKNAPAPK